MAQPNKLAHRTRLDAFDLTKKKHQLLTDSAEHQCFRAFNKATFRTSYFGSVLLTEMPRRLSKIYLWFSWFSMPAFAHILNKRGTMKFMM